MNPETDFEKIFDSVKPKEVYDELIKHRKDIKRLKYINLAKGIAIIFLVMILFYGYNFFSDKLQTNKMAYEKGYREGQQNIVFEIQYKNQIPYLLPEGNNLEINYLNKEDWCKN